MTTVRPSGPAAASTRRISSRVTGLPALAKIANRRSAGTTSRKSSKCLPARSFCGNDKPATSPPGRASLTTKPVLRGPPAPARTIGTTEVPLLCRENACGSRGDRDIDFLPDELGNDLGCALAAPLPPSNLDRDRATLEPAEFAQPLRESDDPLVLNRSRHRARGSDDRQPRRLLRARRERAGGGRAAEKRDELAPFH